MFNFTVFLFPGAAADRTGWVPHFLRTGWMSACRGDERPRLKVIWKTVPSLGRPASLVLLFSEVVEPTQHPPVKLLVLVSSSSLKATKSFHVSATTTQEDGSKDTMLFPLMRHLFLNQTVEHSLFLSSVWLTGNRGSALMDGTSYCR